MSENLRDQGNQEGDRTAAVARKVDLPGEEIEKESTATQRASRAFRSTVVGLILLPFEAFVPRGQTVFQVAFFLPSVVLLPYSAWLLYQIFVSKDKLAGRPRRLAMVAVVLNGAILLLACLFLLSLFLPQRDPRFEYPAEMVGAWKTEDGAVEMELRKNGGLVYRAKGPPETEFSGIWGLGHSTFYIEVRRIIKGAEPFPFPKGQLIIMPFRHYSYWEIVFQGKDQDLRLVRKQGIK